MPLAVVGGKRCHHLTGLKTWNVVFFGSDYFSLACLKELHKNVGKEIKKLHIVTINDRSPIYSFAKLNNLKVYFWPPELYEPYDFGIIVSFGKFIPKRIIEIFPLGIINVHPSLLPRWRGSMPIVYALKNGDTQTGVSIIKTSHEKFDIGEIILQKTISIGENELLPSLFTRLSNLGTECLLEVIQGMPECLNQSVSQSEQEASYAFKLKKDVSLINWNELTAKEIYNLYRALFGLMEIKTWWNKEAVKIFCLSLNKNTCEKLQSLKPGSLYFDKSSKTLLVQCKENCLNICSIKMKGKLYSAHSFYRGCLSRQPKNMWKFDC